MSRIKNIDNWTQCPECGRKERPGKDGLTIHQRMELGYRVAMALGVIPEDQRLDVAKRICEEFRIEVGATE